MMLRYLVPSTVAALLALGAYLIVREGPAGEEAAPEGREAGREPRTRDETRAREIVERLHGSFEEGPRGRREPGAPAEEAARSGEAASERRGATEEEPGDRREAEKRADETVWAREVVQKLQSSTEAGLIADLEDPDPRIRQAVVQMLSDRGANSEAVIRALIPRLADRWEPARKTTIRALVRIGEPAIPALNAALEHEDSLIVQNAVEALDRMGR